jgi:hypothetical protein
MLRSMLRHVDTSEKDSPTSGNVSLDSPDSVGAWPDERWGLFADNCELVARGVGQHVSVDHEYLLTLIRRTMYSRKVQQIFLEHICTHGMIFQGTGQQARKPLYTTLSTTTLTTQQDTNYRMG